MPLPEDVYVVLLRHLRARRLSTPKLTYTQLASAIRGYHGGPRSPRLHAALGEVVRRCHAKKLGALPALVINKQRRRPGPGYYPIAHGPQATPADEHRVWSAEVLRVVADTKRYPATLPQAPLRNMRRR